MAAFDVTTPATQVNQGGQFSIFTHSIFIRNAGNVVATNVEISHPTYLPAHVTFYPREIENTIDRVNRVIRIPKIIPGQAITVSYLDTQLYRVDDIYNTSVRSDEGYAIAQPMALMPVATRTAKIIVGTLMLLGLIFIILVCYKIMPYIASFLSTLFQFK